ncbi:MAG: hypothetical protein J5899_04090, partial [Acidaminococcaceae bacterium]|nr:hypothetical protein [Acidaminococcaceae bacterium]
QQRLTDTNIRNTFVAYFFIVILHREFVKGNFLRAVFSGLKEFRIVLYCIQLKEALINSSARLPVLFVNDFVTVS